MKQDEDIFRSIRLANWSGNLARALLIFALAALSAAALARTLAHWFRAEAGLAVFGWGTVTALAAALIGGWLRRETTVRTAARLDRRFALRNRLESAVELRATDHPIRAMQRAQAAYAWRQVPGMRRLWLHAPLVCALAAALAAGIALGLCRANLQSLREAERVAAGNARAEEKPAGPEEAESGTKKAAPRLEAALTLTYPDEKAEFMPIDLVEWEGAATGNAPWTGIELRLVLNGNALPPVPVTLPEAADAEGKRYPGGGVELDKLGVAPNDLLSLQLAGCVKADGERRVFSAPVLLRIKPLRDELRIVDIPVGATGAPFRDFHATVMEMIRRQTELLRLFFAARGEAELGTPESEVLDMFALLAGEQDKLGGQLAGFVLAEREKEGPGTITAKMLLALNLAVEEMRAARSALARIPAPESRPEALEAAPAAQQRALAALNASLQELTRAIRKQRDEPQTASPSQEAKQQSNVLERLDQAIKSETGLIGEFRANGIRPALAATQGAVTVILQSLCLRRELSEATLAALAAAHGASEKAEAAIPSNAVRALDARTQEALAQMKEARRLIEKQSLTARNDALETARRALSAARRENRRPENSDAEAAARSGEKLAEGARALEAAAHGLAEKGAPADAATLRETGKKMADLSAQLDAVSRAEAATRMEGLRRALKEAQGSGSGASPGTLRDELDRLRREAAYLAKNPQTESKGFLEELQLQIEDLQDYLNAADPARSQAGTKRLREQVAGIPNQLDGWFYAGVEAGDYARIGERLAVVTRLLDEMRQAQSAPAEMFLFAPDQVPKEYRDLAAAYFEALSRRRPEAKKEAAATPETGEKP